MSSHETERKYTQSITLTQQIEKEESSFCQLLREEEHKVFFYEPRRKVEQRERCEII